MGKRIYVGNLPWSVTQIILKNLFLQFGEIEDALVIANKYTGRSRGFGFVTFEKDSAAEKAIKEMNGKSVEGRNLVVKEAMPLKEKAPEEKEERQRDMEEEKEGEEKKERKRGRKAQKKDKEEGEEVS